MVRQNDVLIKSSIGTGILLFVALAIYGYFFGSREMLYDRCLSAILLLVLFVGYRHLKLSITSLILISAALILHNFGLYSDVYLGIPFDRYMHVIGGFAAAYAVYDYLSGRIRNVSLPFIIIALTAGLGSFLEILEFIGYSYLGDGAGILFYGTGDIGEWNNAAWDMICNTVGALLVVIIRVSWFKYRVYFRRRRV